MFPGPKISGPEQQLSRLAEIAEALSMHQQRMMMPQRVLPSESVFTVAQQMMAQSQPPPPSFAAVLQKRTVDAISGSTSCGNPSLVELQKHNTMTSSSSIPGGPNPPTPSLPSAPPSKRRRREEEDEDNPTEDHNAGVEDGSGVGADGDEDDKDVRFREYQAEIWSEKFEDLCEFRRHYGHCHVPHSFDDNAPLAQWVKRQRYQYKLKLENKRSTLSEERVKLLNQIGFIWNSHDVVWEERWHELIAFKNSHGNCIVPSNYDKNPQLAVWVKRQRRQFKFYQENKPTSMTPERIEKLDQLGFAWDCRKNNTGTSNGVLSRSSSDEIENEEMKKKTATTTTAAVAAPLVVAGVAADQGSSPSSMKKTTKPVSPKTTTVVTLPPGLQLGGFPFPKFPTVGPVSTTSHLGGSIVAFKQQQQQQQQQQRQQQQQQQQQQQEASRQSSTSLDHTAVSTSTPGSVGHEPSARSNTIALHGATSVMGIPGAVNPGVATTTPATTLDVSRLPHEFLSFSMRKFTKFPKINIPK